MFVSICVCLFDDEGRRSRLGDLLCSKNKASRENEKRRTIEDGRERERKKEAQDRPKSSSIITLHFSDSLNGDEEADVWLNEGQMENNDAMS